MFQVFSDLPSKYIVCQYVIWGSRLYTKKAVIYDFQIPIRTLYISSCIVSS